MGYVTRLNITRTQYPLKNRTTASCSVVCEYLLSYSNCCIIDELSCAGFPSAIETNMLISSDGNLLINDSTSALLKGNSDLQDACRGIVH